MVGDLVEQLHAVLDELAHADVAGLVSGDEIVRLEQASVRLDAQVARRLRAFDRSKEWSTESRSVTGYVATKTRCSRREASLQVQVARQVDEMPHVADAWTAGAITTEHTRAIAKVRRNARADDAFAEFEPALVEVARA